MCLYLYRNQQSEQRDCKILCHRLEPGQKFLALFSVCCILWGNLLLANARNISITPSDLPLWQAIACSTNSCIPPDHCMLSDYFMAPVVHTPNSIYKALAWISPQWGVKWWSRIVARCSASDNLLRNNFTKQRSYLDVHTYSLVQDVALPYLKKKDKNSITGQKLNWWLCIPGTGISIFFF